MTNSHKIYVSLNHEFTRKDVLCKAQEIGASFSGANSFIEKALFYKKIERIKPGHYRKINV